MTEKQKTVLILCTGNSARSILGEMLINRLGQGRFLGFSAGSTPTGKVNPFALKLLEQKGYSTDGLRSKGWGEFSGMAAPQIDFVFTVCDNAAGETCPTWGGTPLQAHWGIADPADARGSDAEILAAFETAYNQLEARITAFMELPFEVLSEPELQKRLSAIGKI